MKFTSQTAVSKQIIVAVATLLTGCAGFQTGTPGSTPNTGTVASPPKAAEVGTYLEMLDRLRPGDEVRQAAEYAEVAAQAQDNPTDTNRLRYAIALGAAGHPASNPVEARRLLADLLASPNTLRPNEVSLANAYLREFDARVALYADLARQREESDKKLQSLDAEGDRRYAALNAETQKLRKALAEAERKLEAVAEMERALAPEGQ